MNQPTPQEVLAQQGTRLNEAAPWDTYASEMTETLDPALEAEVNAYATRKYEKSSNQTLEAYYEEKELNDNSAKQYQWLRPEEFADQDARIGRVMSHSEFINILRSCKIPCWYVTHPQPQKATLMVQTGGGTLPPEIACWVQTGFMPELSLMRFDDHGVPLDERRRGWRTCLLQLILKGIISEETANKVFGKPRMTGAFHRYNSTLQQMRNVGGRLGE